MTLSSKPRTVLAVDLDYFYAQCEELRNPEIKDKPVVVCVYSGRTDDSGAVSTCNYNARKLGVKSGIPIVQAKKILSSHPEAVFLPMDSAYYGEMSDKVMEILRSHSTIEQVSIDEAYLDVSDTTGGNFSKAKDLGIKIKSEILEKVRLTCSVGIGPNKLIAKMAADSQKPDGLTLVGANEVRSFLGPLPVGKLFGIGPKTEQRLEALGIKQIRELASCDESALVTQFGKNMGPHLKRFAQGIDEEPVREREIEQISRIVTLKHDATTFDFAEDVSTICGDISKKLRERELKCKSVGIIAITTGLKTKNRAKTLANPTNSADVITSEAKSLFESFFTAQTEVRRIGVKVTGLDTSGQRKTNASLTDFLG